MAKLQGISDSYGNHPYDFQRQVTGRSMPYYANQQHPFYTTNAFAKDRIKVNSVTKSGTNILISLSFPSEYVSPDAVLIGGYVSLMGTGKNTGSFRVVDKPNTNTIALFHPYGETEANPHLLATHHPFVGAHAVKCLSDGSFEFAEERSAGATVTTMSMEKGDIEYFEKLTFMNVLSGAFKLYLL